jgi:hypothetical protein
MKNREEGGPWPIAGFSLLPDFRQNREILPTLGHIPSDSFVFL